MAWGAQLLVAVALLLSRGSLSAEDGLARSPPMGWRNWNQYGGEITQEIMEATALAMVAKRDASGAPAKEGVSFLDLGFDGVGLDDNYQACGQGVNGTTFHDASGKLLVNEERFPDMGGMVAKIKILGLRPGFYLNNCICQEKRGALWKGISHYQGDVNATVEWGFNGVKLDNCGAFTDLNLWYKLFSATKDKVLIEACHWGRDQLPTLEHCPFHLFRTSGDVTGTWGSVMSNLQSTRAFQGYPPISRPGCWAYPDSLEVGRLETFEEDRAHFGAWVITSSPLVLGHNVTDKAQNEKIWPIVSNRDAIRINQDWAGHPGRLVKDGIVQVWQKVLSGGAIAVLFINTSKDMTEQVSVSLASLGATAGILYTAFDVWDGMTRRDKALQDSQLDVNVPPHDSVFLQLDAALPPLSEM